LTDERRRSSLPTFNLCTIGPEPSGATPLEPEDLDGLIPDFVATRADLDQVEFENVAAALPWAFDQANRLGSDGILEYGFVLALHRRMFRDVWTWAGELRERVTNIGVHPTQIVSDTIQALDDAKYWHEHKVYRPEELAVRVHCRLVGIHPFRNGNGRCTRMAGDLYLVSTGAQPLSWGGARLDVDGASRRTYIDALVKASNEGEYEDLLRFARG
jgi:Fic-DOC domain mobile mystery protein B